MGRIYLFSCRSFPDDVHIEVAHSLLRTIPLPIRTGRDIREEEIYRSESTIQIVVSLGERLVHIFPDLFTLQRSSGRQDYDLRQRLHNMEGPPAVRVPGLVMFEGRVGVQEIRDLVDNHPDVAAKMVNSQTTFYELLLLHQDFVGDVKSDAFSEDRCREMLEVEVSVWNAKLLAEETYCICFFRRHLRYLPARDEVVPFWSQRDSHTTTEQNEREYVSVLSWRAVSNADNCSSPECFLPFLDSEGGIRWGHFRTRWPNPRRESNGRQRGEAYDSLCRSKKCMQVSLK